MYGPTAFWTGSGFGLFALDYCAVANPTGYRLTLTDNSSSLDSLIPPPVCPCYTILGYVAQFGCRSGTLGGETYGYDGCQ